jgi:hypothetical protein
VRYARIHRRVRRLRTWTDVSTRRRLRGGGHSCCQDEWFASPWGNVTSTQVLVVVSALYTCAACGGSREPLTDGAATSRESPTAAPVALPQTACLQGELRTCLVQLSTQGPVHNCFSGKQICSGGTWSNCTDPATLVGTRTQQFTASCLQNEVAHWTTLDYVADAPSDASGVAAATISPAGHPEILLVDTAAAGTAASAGGAGSLDMATVLGSLGVQRMLTLAITTSTTPNGRLAASVKASPNYECRRN